MELPRETTLMPWDERVPSSYNREPVVKGGTTHEPSWIQSGCGGVDGDGSGVNPRPGRVPKHELLTPETRLDDDGGDGTFHGWRLVSST
jgi:hypothetical protein